jgi:hypothetical protein
MTYMDITGKNTVALNPIDADGIWVLGTVNGVEGWWARFRVISVGANPTPPIQQNGGIYTVVVPYVEIDGEELTGDFDTRLLINLYARSYNTTNNNRALIGARKLSRGADFSAFLNLDSNRNQNPDGITMFLTGGDEIATSFSATGYACEFDSGAGAPLGFSAYPNMYEIARINFAPDIARQYVGEYRAFLRYQQTTAVGNFYAYLQITDTLWSDNRRTKTFTIPKSLAVVPGQYILDMGTFRIGDPLSGDYPMQFTLSVYSGFDTPNDVIVFYDLILIPVDEWAVEATGGGAAYLRKSTTDAQRWLEISAIRDFRRTIFTPLKEVDTTYGEVVAGNWRAATNGAPALKPGASHRLWFLRIWDGTTYSMASISTVDSVAVESNPLFYSLRGST